MKPLHKRGTAPAKQRGRLIVSFQATLNDEQLDALCVRVMNQLWGPDSCDTVVLDLSGLEVLDSFSTWALQKLCSILQLHGVTTVLAGIRPAVAISMARRGLTIQVTYIALDVSEAFDYLDNEPAATHRPAPILRRS